MEKQFHELLSLVADFCDKHASFRDLKGWMRDFQTEYWEIVSGRPSGEVYHREVFVAFSQKAAEHCEAHMDEYKDWELRDWLWGPHIYKRHGNPTDAKAWNGSGLEPAPVWRGLETFFISGHNQEQGHGSSRAVRPSRLVDSIREYLDVFDSIKVSYLEAPAGREKEEVRK